MFHHLTHNNIKYLVIYFNEDPNWNKHVKHTNFNPRNTKYKFKTLKRNCLYKLVNNILYKALIDRYLIVEQHVQE